MNRNKITLYNIASTIILQGLAFISGPVFSGMLGTSNYGIASVYMTWVQIASTIFSLQAAGTLAVARVSFPLEDQEKYQSSVFSLATVSFTCFAFITIVLSLILSRWIAVNPHMVICGLLHSWGLYFVTSMNSKFTYEFKADKNFYLSVITSSLTIGCSILLIHLFPSEINYWGRVLGQTIIYFLVGIFLYVYIIKKGKTIYNKQYWQFTLPLSIPMIFHILANIVLNQSDKVMLHSLISNSAAGVYALACTFGTVLQTIWHALNNSWVPFYYEYTRNGQVDDMRKHAKNYIELYTIISVGFVLMAREVFHLYAKHSFWPGTDLIPLFAMGFYYVFLYSFPVNYEFYNKKTKTIAIGTAGAALCNIILNYFFIRILGIIGAVLATAISHGLQFSFHYICAKRINNGEFPFYMMDFLPGFFVMCITCVVYWFTKDLWLVRWGIGCTCGIYLLLKIIKRKEIF